MNKAYRATVTFRDGSQASKDFYANSNSKARSEAKHWMKFEWTWFDLEGHKLSVVKTDEFNNSPKYLTYSQKQAEWDGY